MSHIALHTLVGTALTDSKFCHDLLNGRRHILLPDFDLTDEEREMVMGIEAESLQDFAAQLCRWLKVQESPVTPSSPIVAPYLSSRSPIRAAFW